MAKSRRLKDRRTSDAFWVSFKPCTEPRIGHQQAGGVTVAGGRVGDILVVGDRTSGGGEGCFIDLSGLV